MEGDKRAVKGERVSYHVKSQKSIKLDEAVKVSKNNRNGNVDNVAGVAKQKTHQLDKFGKSKHKSKLSPKGVATILHVPILSGPPARSQEKGVNGKSKRCKGCDMQSIGAPWLLTVRKILLA